MVALMVGILDPAMSMNTKAKGIVTSAAYRVSSPLSRSVRMRPMRNRVIKKKKAVTIPILDPEIEIVVFS
jgi:hypothetical protein